MGARHYDPATGRFLQPDPLGVAADELYAYAANNPYMFWDPTGLAPRSFSSAAWGAVGDIAVGVGTAAATILIPGAGEALDAYTLADPGAASWERGVAAVSLGVGVDTAGLSPNASGMIHGAEGVARGFGDLAGAARQGFNDLARFLSELGLMPGRGLSLVLTLAAAATTASVLTASRSPCASTPFRELTPRSMRSASCQFRGKRRARNVIRGAGSLRILWPERRRC